MAAQSPPPLTAIVLQTSDGRSITLKPGACSQQDVDEFVKVLSEFTSSSSADVSESYKAKFDATVKPSKDKAQDDTEMRTVIVEDHKGESDDVLVVFAREEDWFTVVDRDDAPGAVPAREGEEADDDDDREGQASPTKVTPSKQATSSTTTTDAPSEVVVKAKRRLSPSGDTSADDDDWVVVDREMLNSAVNHFVSELLIDNPQMLGMREQQLSKLIHQCVNQNSFRSRSAARFSAPSSSSFSSMYWPAIRLAYRAYEMYQGPGKVGFKVITHPLIRNSISSVLQCVLFFVTPA